MTKQGHPRKLRKQFLFWGVVSIFISALACTTFFYIFFSGRIYPNVYIGSALVGGSTVSEAHSVVQAHYEPVKNIEIILTSSTEDVVIPMSQIDTTIEVAKSVNDAYVIARDQSTIANIQTLIGLMQSKRQVGPSISFNEERLNDYISIAESQINNDANPYQITLIQGEIQVDPGKAGTIVDRDELRAQIARNISNQSSNPIAIPIKVIDDTLSSEEVQTVIMRATKLIGKSITITTDGTTTKKSAQDVINLLSPDGYRGDKLALFAKEFAKEVNREPQNPLFNVQNGKVTNFAPALDGLSLNEKDFVAQVISALSQLESNKPDTVAIDAPLVRVSPELVSGDAVSYGIVELLGRGTSIFKGSISSRVFNVGHAAAKIDGTLIAPGETFSFNKIVGDISQLTGFKQAYVIQDGRTVLGDGGGVCQVSTTLFRAVMNSGLPVAERRAHSYRVGYYEQDASPGLDATIYSPTTDFKFTNDTGHYVLVHTIPDLKNYRLTFELYGTKDGRVAEISKPVISNVGAPPEDLYVDDPTLPTGQVKQVEHKAWGARSTFAYKVTKDGQTLHEKTFVSNYRPWQAVFMRGVGPAQ